MAGDLSLKISGSSADEIKISWRDALKTDKSYNNTRGWAIGVIFVLCVIGMITLEPSQPGAALGIPLITIFIVLPATLLVIDVSAKVDKFRYSANEVSITKTVFKHTGRSYDVRAISRVDYGSRGEWDMSDISTKNRTQIRVWFEDNNFIVISENDWVASVNHQIRNAIDKALLEVRKTASKDKHVEEHGKKGDFGIPEY